VPDTKSRAALGEISDGGLFELFQSRHGAPGTPAFEEARHNFIVAQSGYAVASYLVQSKDRHNGNILLDSCGRIVHIDFGFIFEISPGGNLGFERSAFKFSHEMVQLIDPGGQQRSRQYKHFKELCVRGYLAARTAANEILTVAELMIDSGLPCFGRGKPIEHLRQRFRLDKSPADAAAFMQSAVDSAHNSFTTGFYDYIQVCKPGFSAVFLLAHCPGGAGRMPRL
jgi:phosphatidylinositol 4-kinase A